MQQDDTDVVLVNEDGTYSELELRMRCIELAIAAATANDIVEVAKRIHAFVTAGGEEIEVDIMSGAATRTTRSQ